MTRVLVQPESSSRHAYIDKVEIRGLSTAELSNTFRELLEEKLAKEVMSINEEPTATETKFQKVPPRKPTLILPWPVLGQLMLNLDY